MNMSKRIKLPVQPRIDSVEKLEETLARVCVLTARQQGIEAEMSARITGIRQEYEVDIATTGGELAILHRDVQAYADAHPELFARAKSVEFVHATIGFRTGTPKLAKLRAFTWATVLELVREKLPAYLRVSEEVNKEKLLADREALGEDGLRAVGVAARQDETFFIKAKLETINATRQC
jgi:phage host-nuclease inhibitor protein Gam